MQSFFSYSRLIGLGTGLAIIPFSLHADDSGDNDWNHFGLNFRAGFNASAKFSESGGGGGAGGGILPPVPGAGSAVNRQYSDGYVDVDRSGNQGGKTWNWSYQNASQIGDDVINFHDTASVGNGSGDRKSDDPNYGVDFNYVRDIIHAKWGQLGIKIGFGYTPIDIHDNTPLGANTETITDQYQLGGVVPPAAPYTGSFNGPGPVIGSTPTRTISEAPGGLSLGNRSLDTSLYDFRLGPTVNIPIYKRLSVQAGGGVVLAIADSEYDYVEYGAPGTPSVSGSSSHTGLNLGAYAELGFAFKLSSSTSLFTGAQYEYLGNFNQSSGGSSAELDLGSTFFYEFGIQFHF